MWICKTAASCRLLHPTIDTLRKLQYWCSNWSTIAESCHSKNGTITDRALRAVDHCFRASTNTFRANLHICKRMQKSIIVSGADVDRWIHTVTQVYKDSETRGEHRQKMCTDHFDKNFLVVMNQMLCSIRFFVQAWNPGMLNKTEDHDSLEQKIYHSTNENWGYIPVVAWSSDRTFAAVWIDHSTAFGCPELRAVHEYYTTKISENCKETILIGSGACSLSLSKSFFWRVLHI